MTIKKDYSGILKITLAGVFLSMLFFLFQPVFVFAAENVTGDVQVNLDQLGNEVGLEKQDIRVMVGKGIKIALGLLGGLAIIIVLYAGYLYMMSGGEPTKLSEAQKWLKNGAIGLIIIFSAYSIVSFIFSAFEKDYQPGGGNYNLAGQLTGQGFGLSGGAFGSVIQSHYPAPEQNQVPRNTMIMVTFKEPIAATSIIDENDKNSCPDYSSLGIAYGGLKKDAMRIFNCADMIEESYGDEEITCFDATITDISDGRACDANEDCSAGSCENGICSSGRLVPGCAMLTQDKKTIIFDPYGQTNNHLGSPDNETSYVVYLTNLIKKDSADQSVFNNANPDYRWRFTTSTILDTTPPKVSGVAPKKQVYPVVNAEGCQCSGDNPGCSEVDCDGKVYLNQVIYVNFDEPVIPPLVQEQTCSSADDDNEAQVEKENGLVGSCSTAHLPGGWVVGLNQYKTIQFVSNTECAGGARNSCGEIAKCLPENSGIIGKIFPARLLEGSDSGIPGTGIMDLGGNPLDGNGDGTVDGPGLRNAAIDDVEEQKDNYFWRFETGNVLDLRGPWIVSLEPGNATQNISDVNIPLKVNFSEFVDAESVDQEISLIGVGADGKDFRGWFDVNYGSEILDEVVSVNMSQAAISHAPFDKWYEGGNSPYYSPVVSSNIKDSRLNCYSPTKDSISGSACANLPAGYSCCPNGSGFSQSGVNQGNCSLPWQK